MRQNDQIRSKDTTLSGDSTLSPLGLNEPTTMSFTWNSALNITLLLLLVAAIVVGFLTLPVDKVLFLIQFHFWVLLSSSFSSFCLNLKWGGCIFVELINFHDTLLELPCVCGFFHDCLITHMWQKKIEVVFAYRNFNQGG